MNRCAPHPLRALLLTLAACASLAALPASAQTTEEAKPEIRQFPAAALRGELVVKTPPLITLDGKDERLSPGARIRGLNNFIVMSAPLIDKKLTVNYLRENNGMVHEVWILNKEEAKLKRPNSKASFFGFLDGGSDNEAVLGLKTP
ncbi:MAG: hypothetical protein JWR60_1975 [Polaromonas sp.]|nr:hypothetical protein [Polaromonas sp.]